LCDPAPWAGINTACSGDPMEILERIHQRARSIRKTLVFAGRDGVAYGQSRGKDSVRRACPSHSAGSGDGVLKAAASAAVSLQGAQIIDPLTSPMIEKLISGVAGVARPQGRQLGRVPANAAKSADVRSGPGSQRRRRWIGGRGDGMSPAILFRAAIQGIGLRKGFTLVSSFFLMLLRDKSMGSQGVWCFADCGVVPQPSAVQLAEIAIAAADSARLFSGR